MTDRFEHPVYDWIDDNAPHLNLLTFSELRVHPETREIFERLEKDEIEKAKAAAAKKAADTRRKNAKTGITQKNIKGSTKQKKWASEIRGEFVKRFSDTHKNAVNIALNFETAASRWIEKRNSLVAFADGMERHLKSVNEAAEKLDAEFASRGITPGSRFDVDDDLQVFISENEKATAEMWAYIS